MTPAITYDELKSLNPCSDSLKRVARLMGGAWKWNGRKVTAQQAREAGATFDDIVWIAAAVARNDKDVERRLRLWMADCAAHVLHIYEDYQDADKRPRNAIIAARQFARGEIDEAARDAAWEAAWEAAREAAWEAAREAAREAAWEAARAARDAARDAAREAAREAAEAAEAAWAVGAARAEEAAEAAARAAEEQWQFDRLILWLSDNEPNDYPLPAEKVAA